MHSYIFKQKLAKLNKNLYLNESAAATRTKDFKASGIYLKQAERTDNKSNYHQLNADAQTWLAAKEAGQMDMFITGCPLGFIPEFDILDLESGRIEAKGWRSIALYLVKEKICSLEKARKVFSPSLGESDFDRAGYDGKLDIARKAAGYKTTKELLSKYA